MDLEIRAISEKHNIKMSIIDITESFQKIVDLQQTNPLASLAAGRVTIANALIGLSQKNNEKITSVINGAGYIGTIISEYQNNAVRTYVQIPDFDITGITQGEISPLAQVVGKNGFLQVTRDSGMKEPYTSRVQLVNGEINIDYMYYLNQSEQIHSIIASDVKIDNNGKIKKAVGLIVQLLPEYTDEDINFLEEKLGSLDYTTKVLSKTTNYHEFLKDIAFDVKILSNNTLKFECTCSVEKVLASVKLLGKDELEKIIEQAEDVEVVCDFCKKKYVVSVNEVKKILN
ncbi:Hsp33 family molecular chaperone HslO [Spiroplasma endosymbiont of Labia minor]|uniref:Hsp33 family molecular chaperone HslO n=1 Tax=Spiroplasma endosymbiont of Labia minor TaxID=3066305 RepID=UPI0030CDD54A